MITPNQIYITQPVTSVIQVATIGPKGDKGDKGDTSNQIATGSVTASVNVGSDTFKVVSGSSTFLYISSSGRIGVGTTNPALGLLQLSATDENPHANLYINGDNGGTGSITVRANNGHNLSIQKTYNPIGGSDSLNFIQLLDTDTTTIANQPIGRIIFTSNDGDTNEFTTKAFIEAVAEDSTPDSFLAFGTNQSGSNTTERMRINSSGSVGIGTFENISASLHISGANNNLLRVSSPSSPFALFVSSSGRVGIGTGTPTNTLQVVGGITATSLTGSFSGSVRAPGASGDLLRNFNGVLSSANGAGVFSNANAITVTDVVSIPGTDAGGLRLIVGPGDGNTKHYAIIPEIYTSKGEAALGNRSFSTAQRQVGGKQIQDFILTTGITGGDPKTGITASVMSLTEDQNVGIGTTTPTAKLQVVGSVLISGSSTLTNVGPAVFSGSITQQPSFTSSLGYLSVNSALINGDVTVTGTASINTLRINEIIVSTGSNQFGDTANDTQTLYGSVIIPTGSLTVTGSATITDLLNSLNISTTSITASTIGSLIAGQFTPYIRYNTTNIVASSSFGHTTAYMLSDAGGFFGANDISFYAGAFTQPEIMRIVGSTGFVGIGESSPSAKLEIRGSGATSATTALRIENSNQSASLTILDDGTSAFNTNHLYVSSSGRIGIGTTSPTAQLHVSGTTILQGSGSTIFSVQGSLGELFSVTDILSGSLSSINNAYGLPIFEVFSNDVVNIGTFGNEAISVSGSRTGMGTATPQAKLHISGATSQQLLEIDAGGSATPVFVVSGSGLVGIGTLTPTNTLQVVGGITATSITSSLLGTASVAVTAQTASFLPTGTYSITSSWAQNALTASFITPAGTNAFAQGGNSFGTTALLGTNDNQNLQLETSGSVRMTIDSSGNVGIGTTTPAARLQVRGSGTTSATTALIVQNSTPTNLMTILDDGTMTLNGNFVFGSNALAPVNSSGLFSASGTAIRLGDALASNSVGYQTHVISPGIVDRNFISGEGGVLAVGGVAFGRNFNPTSGNGVFNIIRISQIINQTGGASGITRGLFISPTLTSAADWRSVEWSNNQGFGLYGVGAAPNYLSGSLGIGTTSPSASLHISGANADTLLRVSSPLAPSALFVSGSGNVGIGTTSPTATLGVSGSTIITGSFNVNAGTTTPHIRGAALRVSELANGAIGTLTLGSVSNIFSDLGAFSFRGGITGTTEFMYLSGSRVGIGTNSPSTTLNVNGTTLLQGGQTTVRGSGATSATTALRVENSNQSASLVVRDDGNVGIGTTTPSASLHIEGNLQISTGSLYTYGQNTDIDSGSIRTVMSVSTGSYRAAFFDYVLNKSTNARAGIVFSVWNGTSVEWNDVSTNDIGNTTEVNLSVGLSGANVVLYASSSTNDWSVKALARMI